MFTMFTDRDGKYQLAALAESGFDPLARTTKFMLTEEAHHLFVGEMGVDRVVRRAAELTKLDPNGDARAQGGIDLGTIQKYLNYWYSLSLDLFGGEVSTNAADFFASGLKGRFREEEKAEHTALGQSYELDNFEDGRISRQEVPLRNAMNEVLRDEYVKDCERAVAKWNRTLEASGLEFRLKLPSRRFHREIGPFARQPFDPDGQLVDRATFEARQGHWLPTAADRAWVKGVQKAVYAPGQMAHWIAPPAKGINGQGADFEYVKRVR
jgi:benzoyl-CoA 2,3-dioxygenase component B